MIELNGIEIYVYLFCNAFSIFIISLFMTIFFEKEVSGERKLFRRASYILYWGISSIGYLYFQWPPVLMLLLTISGTSVISLTYTGSWKYRISAVVTIVAVQIVCENTIWFLLVKLHAEQLFIIGLLAVQILTFMVAVILRKMVDLKRGGEALFGDWISVIVIPVWSIFIAIIVLDGCENEFAVAICGSSMLLINVLVFYILARMQSIYREKLDIKTLEQQNQAYAYQMSSFEKRKEMVTALHHDMKNHFLALEHLAEDGQSEEIRKYLNALNMTPQWQNRNQTVETGNDIIDGFLNMKLEEARKCGAEIKLDIRISKALPMDAKDISIILGNLLDNAVEALKKMTSERHKKYISIIMREEPGKLYLQIKNSHREIIKRTGKNFQTTKENKEGHGVGLKNVNRIAASYAGTLEIEYTDHEFMVELLLFFRHAEG